MKKKPITYLIIGWIILIFPITFTDNSILKYIFITLGFFSIIYAFIVYYKK